MWNRKQFLVASWICLLLALSLATLLAPKVLAQVDVWAYSDLLCRKYFNITSTQGNLADYPIILYVNNGSTADSGNTLYIVNNRTDFSDVAFALDSGALLPFWVENYTTSVKANFWVKIPYINSTVTKAYIYYASLTSPHNSDGANVFPFFDNFTGSSLDPTKWTVNYTASSFWSISTVANNQLNFTGGAASTWYNSQRTDGNQYVITYAIPTNCSILTWVDTQSPTAAQMFQSGLIICDTSKNVQISNFVYDGGAAITYNTITYYSYIGTGHNATDSDFSGGTGVANFKLEIQKFGTSYNLSEYKANPKGYVFYKGSYSATTVSKIGLANDLYSSYAFAKSCSFRFFVVRPLVNPDPTPSAWGSVEVNSFILWATAPSILYPYPEGYAFLNMTLQSYGGLWQHVVNASLDLTTNGIEIILLWLNVSNTFSVYSDVGHYCVLNATDSVRTVLNSSSITVSWSVAFRSNMTEGYVSVSSTNTLVWSDTPYYASFGQSNWFYFEHDHTVITRFTFSPSNPIIGQTIQFNGTVSLTTKDISSYSWNFGDGTSNTTSLEPVKSYGSANTFTVTLTITTTDGFNQFSQVIVVSSDTSYIIASFTWSPENPAIAEWVTFDASASASSGAIANYTWQFAAGDSWNSGISSTAQHYYSDNATFQVSLIVGGDVGNSSTLTLVVIVGWGANHTEITRIVAAFAWAPVNPSIDEQINFTSYSNSTSSITNYSWNFGDGNTTSGASLSNINHTYPINASFSVVLTVTSSVGSISINESITIGWGANHTCVGGAAFTYSIARFEFSPSNPGNTTVILFNGSQSYTTEAITDYSWEFGDGNTTSSGAQDWIEHAYGTDGTYDVTLTVSSAATNVSQMIFHQVEISSSGVTYISAREGYAAYWFAGLLVILLIAIPTIVFFMRRK